MGWQMILALILVVPVILIPVALVWYINAGGISVALKEARDKRAARTAMSRESSARE